MSFFANMYTVFIQIVILAFIVIIGVFADKTNIFNEKTAKRTVDLLFYIITPVVIINSFSKVEFTKANGLGFLTAFLCSAAFHVIAIIAVTFLFKKGDRDKNAVFKYATVYGNMGYMGLPLSFAVMQSFCGSGDIGTFYCSAAIAAFNIFAFTHGVWLMSGDAKNFNYKKLIFNPGTIGIFIGAPIFLLNITLPEIIQTPLTHIGNMNTPLAMLMFGTYISKANFKTMFKQGNMYVTALFKLVVLPVVTILAFYFAGIRGNMLVAAAVFISAPTANNTVMFAAKFNKDTGLASQVSAFVSILSMVTMPACIAFAMSL